MTIHFGLFQKTYIQWLTTNTREVESWVPCICGLLSQQIKPNYIIYIYIYMRLGSAYATQKNRAKTGFQEICDLEVALCVLIMKYHSYKCKNNNGM